MIPALTTHIRRLRRSPILLPLLVAFTCVAACNREPATPAARPTPATPLERGIQLARRQLAKNIFVISRPDGGTITAEDRAFIRQSLPRDYVYSGITDDNRNVIVSMHIEFPPENLNALRQRYNVAQVQI
jgi:hypothetical protein